MRFLSRGISSRDAWLSGGQNSIWPRFPATFQLMAHGHITELKTHLLRAINNADSEQTTGGSQLANTMTVSFQYQSQEKKLARYDACYNYHAFYIYQQLPLLTEYLRELAIMRHVRSHQAAQQKREQ